MLHSCLCPLDFDWSVYIDSSNAEHSTDNTSFLQLNHNDWGGGSFVNTDSFNSSSQFASKENDGLIALIIAPKLLMDLGLWTGETVAKTG